MNLLKRELAPILPSAWSEIDNEAVDVLKVNLAGRKLVDFAGPYGWDYAAVSTGRLDYLKVGLGDGVPAAQRRVLPLIELRVPAVLKIAELDMVVRGARDIDVEPINKAARRIANAEDTAIFNGLESAGIAGIIPSSPHAPIKVANVADYPRAVLEAREVLRRAGVTGPYALALGTRQYEELMAATNDGYPVARQIERFGLDDRIVQAPSIDRAVVLSTRGGDFQLTVGQDHSIGYAFHDRDEVELYITESFTFRVLSPEAAVAIDS